MGGGGEKECGGDNKKLTLRNSPARKLWLEEKLETNLEKPMA